MATTGLIGKTLSATTPQPGSPAALGLKPGEKYTADVMAAYNKSGEVDESGNKLNIDSWYDTTGDAVVQAQKRGTADQWLAANGTPRQEFSQYSSSDPQYAADMQAKGGMSADELAAYKTPEELAANPQQSTMTQPTLPEGSTNYLGNAVSTTPKPPYWAQGDTAQQPGQWGGENLYNQNNQNDGMGNIPPQMLTQPTGDNKTLTTQDNTVSPQDKYNDLAQKLASGEITQDEYNAGLSEVFSSKPPGDNKTSTTQNNTVTTQDSDYAGQTGPVLDDKGKPVNPDASNFFDNLGFGQNISGAVNRLGEINQVTDPYWNASKHAANENWWGNALDTLSPEQIADSMNPNFKEWAQYGPGGERYDEAERFAMDKAASLANRDSAASGAQFSQDYLNQVNANKDDLTKAVEGRLTAAAQGQLLDENSPAGQYYRAMKDEMRLNAEDEKENIARELAANRSLYGSKYVGQLSKLAERQTATMNTKLADLALNEANGARDYVIANKGLNNAILEIGAKIAQNGTTNQQTAVNTILDNISNMTAHANTQANMKLETAKSQFLAQMQKVEGIGDLTQFDKEFDMKYQDMLNDNLNEWLTGGGNGGIMGTISKFIAEAIAGG